MAYLVIISLSNYQEVSRPITNNPNSAHFRPRKGRREERKERKKEERRKRRKPLKLLFKSEISYLLKISKVLKVSSCIFKLVYYA